jgi:4-cresol dehydrogenase (hydroxylating)
MINTAMLPPGVSKARFDKALGEFRALLGDSNVIADLARLVSYTKIMIPDDEVRHQPSGVLSATTVEQVQGVLAICTKYRIPVWTISTGRNFGYGSAAPATPGQIVLDLRRMNKILDVDAEMCTALVEPGVTYKELDTYIRERDLPLWLSFPSSGPIVGPVGNTLERGVGYNRYGEQANHFCGLEVVMADGQVLRTGMGGVKGSNTWQSYRWGYGPWLDGLFLQSNFGVVTKMGLWLMAKPESYKGVFVPLGNDEAMVKAVDTARKLRLNMVIENCLIGHSLYNIAMLAQRKDLFPGPGPATDQMFSGLLDAIKAPPYGFICTLYGTEEQVKTNLDIVRKAFKDIGPVLTSDDIPPGPKSPLEHMQNNMTGKLTLNEFGVYNYRGGGGSAWFSPVIQMKGSEALKSLNLCKAVYNEFGFEYLGGFLIGYSGRHLDHVTDLLFDRTNPEEMKRAHACFKKLIEVNAANGYAVYRVNTAFMNDVADVYGPVQKAVNRKLKRALDPNGILAPGKSGIFL